MGKKPSSVTVIWSTLAGRLCSLWNLCLFPVCLIQDWEYLLSSDYHRNFESHPVAKALRLDPLEVLAPKDDFSQSLSLDSSTLLFTHIPAVFFVLHLIYEELKLNSLMGEGIRSLVVVLVQLARYAQLTNHRYCILRSVSWWWVCIIFMGSLGIVQCAAGF